MLTTPPSSRRSLPWSPVPRVVTTRPSGHRFPPWSTVCSITTSPPNSHHSPTGQESLQWSAVRSVASSTPTGEHSPDWSAVPAVVTTPPRVHHSPQRSSLPPVVTIAPTGQHSPQWSSSTAVVSSPPVDQPFSSAASAPMCALLLAFLRVEPLLQSGTQRVRGRPLYRHRVWESLGWVHSRSSARRCHVETTICFLPSRRSLSSRRLGCRGSEMFVVLKGDEAPLVHSTSLSSSSNAKPSAVFFLDHQPSAP